MNHDDAYRPSPPDVDVYRPTTPDWREAWEGFLAGHWTREMPQREGTYFLATDNGYGGTNVVYQHEGVFKSQRSWGAWWWSEPTPDLPKPPIGAVDDHA